MDQGWVTGPGREHREIYTALADASTDLEGQTGSAIDCGRTVCCYVAPQPENNDLPELTLAVKRGCC
jgi:hypothetical protein